MHRILRPLSRRHARLLSTSLPARTAWSPGPSPPRLPKEEQDIFDQLQRQSTGAFSTPSPSEPAADAAPSQRTPPRVNQSPHSEPEPAPAAQTAEQQLQARVQATGDGEELHPNVRRGAAPEFEGERNPVTGETGGPKNEPLRWGGQGDWSYNGRVTDF